MNHFVTFPLTWNFMAHWIDHGPCLLWLEESVGPCEKTWRVDVVIDEKKNRSSCEVWVFARTPRNGLQASMGRRIT